MSDANERDQVHLASMQTSDDTVLTEAGGSENTIEPEVDSVLVWDLPTRVFHWTLVISFISAMVISDPDRFRDIHVFFGYVVLGLICFRIVWGLIGTRYARFASFWYGPRTAIVYLIDVMRGRAARHIGHNPAGSLGIYALLALGLLICISGIVVLGAEEAQGIFRSLTDRPTGEAVRHLHEILAWLMVAAVCVHLGGVVFESIAHRENLAKSMITGRKIADPDEGIGARHPWVALAILVCVAASAVWLLHWRLVNIPGLEHLPYVGRQLPDNKTWRESCSTCHKPFHPTLLPARSWNALLDRPHDHFGLQWSFDKATLGEIREFLQQHSAETFMTEAAYKINKSIPADHTPLRITETAFWTEKHGKIDENVWADSAVSSKSNCIACHRDADYGTFEDAAMRLPVLSEKR